MVPAVIKPTLAVAALISPLMATPARAAPAVRGAVHATAHSRSLVLRRPPHAARRDVLVSIVTVRRGRKPVRLLLPRGWHRIRQDLIASRRLLQVVAYHVVGAHEPGHYRFSVRGPGVAAGGIVDVKDADVSHPIRAVSARESGSTARPAVPPLHSIQNSDLGIVAVSSLGASHVSAPSAMRHLWDARTRDLRASTGASVTVTGSGATLTRTGLTVGLSIRHPLASVVTSIAVQPAAAAAPAASRGPRPYASDSPWNSPIGSAHVSSKSSSYIQAISDNGASLTADPDQYTIPVYTFNSSTPTETVTGGGNFGAYDSGDSKRVGKGSPWTMHVPVPDGAAGGSGSDGQIEIWDPKSGIEYGFWQFQKTSSGHYQATNGYRYHTGSGYHGRFADGGAGRGAGTPYLAGLVRPWEIAQGHIDHALAFAYDSPAPTYVYPASRSDGGGSSGIDLPEGTRIQLDPGLTDADFDRMHLNAAAKVIAHALQKYGMYVIDNSGASKVYLEDRSTAHWGSEISRNMLAGLPWSDFRVVDPPAH
jgi:hypothetical protein